MAESDSSDADAVHSAQPAVVLLTIVLIVAAGAVSWYGVQRPVEVASTSQAAVAAVAPQATASSLESPTSFEVAPITLPHFVPIFPPGPHREVFMTNCVTCHSPRLITDQPSFPRQQWEEIVHKMAVTFGGHIAEEDRPQIVDYLVSIRGTSSEK